MKNKFLGFLFILIVLAFCQPACASHFNSLFAKGLIHHQVDWPNWTLPAPLKRPRRQDDLNYPNWFEGAWNVVSYDLNDPNQKPLEHSAIFMKNSRGEIVADREFNTKSLSQAVLGKQFLNAKNDPKNPNRQFAEFSDKKFLDTTVIGRSQELNNMNQFINDELSLLVFYSPGEIELSQVETLSIYSLCKSEKREMKDFICGYQWQAVYPSPSESLTLKPKKTARFKLILTPLQ